MTSFLRPIEIKFEQVEQKTGILAMSFEDDVEVEDIRTGLKTIKKFRQVYLNQNLEPTTGINIGADVNGPEWFHLQTAMQEAVSGCNTLAESLLGSLRNFLIQYYNNQEKTQQLMLMEFMKLRDELSNEVIKKDVRVEGAEGLKSQVEKKFFTKTFCDFITDRNIYTHGHLHVRWPEKKFIIKYIENKRENAYCEINTDIIQSYYDCYKYLKKTLEQLFKVTR